MNWKDKYKLAGICRDLEGTLIGRYAFLWHPDQQEIYDRFCESWLRTYRDNENFVLTRDYETTGLLPYGNEVILNSVSWDYDNAIIICPTNLDNSGWVEVLNTIPTSNQNNKFDARYDIHHFGADPDIWLDTLTANQLGWSGIVDRFGLDFLVDIFLDELKIDKKIRMDFTRMRKVKSEEDGLYYWLGKGPADEDLTDKHIQYAGQDSMLTHRLIVPTISRLYEQNLYSFWENVERPLLNYYARDELKGIKVDWDFINKIYKEKEAELKKVYDEIQDIVSSLPEKVKKDFKNAKLKNKDFNPGSPTQIISLMKHYGVKLPNTEKSTMKSYQNKMIGVEEKADAFEMIKRINTYREQAVMLVKYIKPWAEKYVNPHTNKIHPDIQIIASKGQTGRLAARDPNIMAIMGEFRPAVICEDDEVLAIRDYCYDDQTEVLTQSGWKFFKDVIKTDKVLTINPENFESDWLAYEDKVEMPYRGKMLSIQGQGVDLLTSPNHKHLVNTHWDKKSEWSLMSSKEVAEWDKRLYFKKNCQPIKGTKEYKGLKGNQVKNFLKLIGYYLGDGSLVTDRKSIRFFDGEIEILHKYEEILKQFGIRSRINKGPTCYNLTFRWGFFREVIKDCGDCYGKHIPESLWNLDGSLLEGLFEGLIDSDGTTRPNESKYKGPSNGQPSKQFTTVSKKLADDFQRLLVHIGLSGTNSVLQRPPRKFPNGKVSNVKPSWTCSVNQYRNEPCLFANGRRPVDWVEYDGKIYCLTMSKWHVLMVRRNGKTVLSHNSQFEFRGAAGISKETVMLDAFIKRADLLEEMKKVCVKYEETDPDTFVKLVTEKNEDFMAKFPSIPDEVTKLCIDFMGTDIHRCNGARMFHVNPEDVDGKQRSVAKTLGYAVLYGGGASTVQEQMADKGMFYTIEECEEFTGKFFAALPNLKKQIDFLKASVLDPGYIQTPMGRRKFSKLPPTWRRDYGKKLADLEREFANAMFQSSNADATKMSMVELINIFNEEFDEHERPRILFPVHDELVVVCKEKLQTEVFDLIGEVMVSCGSRAILDSCPIEVSGIISKHWVK